MLILNICYSSARKLLALILGTLTLTACVTGPTNTADYDRDQAKEEIWAKELAIYQARGRGDLQVYVDSTSDHYRGWPPGWPEPSGTQRLRAAIPSMRSANQEELTMEFADIAFSGNAAVIYYNTHRTRKPRGEPVDERFEIIHVWSRENGEWKLLGAMGRNKPEPVQ